jgi:hypothetical protein
MQFKLASSKIVFVAAIAFAILQSTQIAFAACAAISMDGLWDAYFQRDDTDGLRRCVFNISAGNLITQSVCTFFYTPGAASLTGKFTVKPGCTFSARFVPARHSEAVIEGTLSRSHEVAAGLGTDPGTFSFSMVRRK